MTYLRCLETQIVNNKMQNLTLQSMLSQTVELEHKIQLSSVHCDAI